MTVYPLQPQVKIITFIYSSVSTVKRLLYIVLFNELTINFSVQKYSRTIHSYIVFKITELLKIDFKTFL